MYFNGRGILLNHVRVFGFDAISFDACYQYGFMMVTMMSCSSSCSCRRVCRWNKMWNGRDVYYQSRHVGLLGTGAHKRHFGGKLHVLVTFCNGKTNRTRFIGILFHASKDFFHFINGKLVKIRYRRISFIQWLPSLYRKVEVKTLLSFHKHGQI